jgi:hypothetical protein
MVTEISMPKNENTENLCKYVFTVTARRMEGGGKFSGLSKIWTNVMYLVYYSFALSYTERICYYI